MARAWVQYVQGERWAIVNPSRTVTGFLEGEFKRLAGVGMLERVCHINGEEPLAGYVLSGGPGRCSDHLSPDSASSVGYQPLCLACASRALRSYCTLGSHSDTCDAVSILIALQCCLRYFKKRIIGAGVVAQR